MKNLENLTHSTEYNVISAAYDHFLSSWGEKKAQLDKMPENEILQNTVNILWSKAEELREILLEMVNDGNAKTQWGEEIKEVK